VTCCVGVWCVCVVCVECMAASARADGGDARRLRHGASLPGARLQHVPRQCLWIKHLFIWQSCRAIQPCPRRPLLCLSPPHPLLCLSSPTLPPTMTPRFQCVCVGGQVSVGGWVFLRYACACVREGGCEEGKQAVERVGGVNALERCHDVGMAGWCVLVSRGGVCWCDASGVGVTPDLLV